MSTGDVAINLPPRQSSQVAALSARRETAGQSDTSPKWECPRGGSILQRAAAFEERALGKFSRTRHPLRFGLAFFFAFSRSMPCPSIRPTKFGSRSFEPATGTKNLA